MTKFEKHKLFLIQILTQPKDTFSTAIKTSFLLELKLGGIRKTSSNFEIYVHHFQQQVGKTFSPQIIA